MRGLIYKDFSLFFKGIDKKLIFIVIITISILMFKAGIYAGLLATVLVAMTIGMQNTMSFAIDEKTNWEKYQLTMPVSNTQIVGSRYLSVLLTLCVSISAAIVFFLISGIIYQSFDMMLLMLSVIAAIVLPIIWTALCLPLTYWFGFRSAQMMNFICVIPIFCLVKYFEDGAGLSLTSLGFTLSSYLILSLIVAAIVFVVSYFVSILGYAQKK